MFKKLTALALCLTLLTGIFSLSAAADGYRDAAAANGTPSVSVQTEDGATVAFMTANRLSYTACYGADDGSGVFSEEQAFDSALTDAFQNGSEGMTTSSSTGFPYQIFDVDVSGVNASDIILSFDGSTVDNERMALKAYNHTTGLWDTLGTAVGAGQISAAVSLADYAKDGKLRAMATVDYVGNGSNRIIWSTDPQHYVKFKDLNSMYEGIHNYMVSEYQAGNIAYVVNTGDIVDDMPNLAGAKSQWATASEMFKILDDAGVPYGIETGNHDTGDYPALDYKYYLQHFNAERYENNAWFGGTEDNNVCHYDLVTVGNTDLLFLYLGYGMEATPETVAWANEVLDMYPHRNAIICTHQYLSSRKADWSGSSRANLIFSEIINEHDNVMMVLCGHDDGAARTSHQTDSGRTVYEILSDCQFVQIESADYYADAPDPTHSIGSVPDCNGEGYIRSIDIKGNRVSMDTFSPVTGGTRPYGVRDCFSIDVDFIEAHREITTKAFTACAVSDTLDTVKLTASGTATCSKTVDASQTWLAKIDFSDGTLYTTAVTGSAAASDQATTVYTDKGALQKLIEKVSATEGSYVKETWDALQAAKSTAQNALKNGSDEEIAAAYRTLSIALGELTEIDTTVMDRSRLKEVYTFSLAPESWTNSEGAKKLTGKNSYVTPTVTETGGLEIVASKKSPNNFPQITYTEPVEVTPEGGKLYLYLDVHSTNGWSVYPTVIQGTQMYEGRWNYAIEDSKNKTWDAGNGDYVGVYDVTQALVDLGVDMTQPMIITMKLHTVPGPLTINEMVLLTGEYREGLTLESVWPWLLLGGVLLLAVVAVLIAILYKPKKKQTTPATDTCCQGSGAAQGTAPTDKAASTAEDQPSDDTPPDDTPSDAPSADDTPNT